MGRGERLDELTDLLSDELERDNVVPPEVINSAIENLAKWALPLLEPRRYKCLHGGRGSGKSYAIADALLIEACKRKVRCLCGREFQNSLSESVHQLLSERIEALGLSDYFTVLESKILAPFGGEFIFKGLRHNSKSLKSLQGLTHVWIEEAQTITSRSWDDLTPTVRAKGSEIWISFNPEQKTDCMYQRFVVNGEASDYTCRVNWDMNPHFPDELEDERQRMLRTDPDKYDNIWEGNCIKHSKAQIFYGRWVVDTFEPADGWGGPYYGGDFGFASDPSAAARFWISPNNRLCIEYESYAYHVPITQLANRWIKDCPGIEKYLAIADSARPDTIHHLKTHGIPRIRGAIKGKNSVEDGIEFIKGFEQIVIHPRCKNMRNEAMRYQYKVDPHTKEVMDVIIDADNHLWDSIRYGSEPIRKRHGSAKRSGIKLY